MDLAAGLPALGIGCNMASIITLVVSAVASHFSIPFEADAIHQSLSCPPLPRPLLNIAQVATEASILDTHFMKFRPTPTTPFDVPAAIIFPVDVGSLAFPGQVPLAHFTPVETGLPAPVETGLVPLPAVEMGLPIVVETGLTLLPAFETGLALFAQPSSPASFRPRICSLYRERDALRELLKPRAPRTTSPASSIITRSLAVFERVRDVLVAFFEFLCRGLYDMGRYKIATCIFVLTWACVTLGRSPSERGRDSLDDGAQRGIHQGDEDAGRSNGPLTLPRWLRHLHPFGLLFPVCLGCVFVVECYNIAMNIPAQLRKRPLGDLLWFRFPTPSFSSFSPNDLSLAALKACWSCLCLSCSRACSHIVDAWDVLVVQASFLPVALVLLGLCLWAVNVSEYAQFPSFADAVHRRALALATRSRFYALVQPILPEMETCILAGSIILPYVVAAIHELMPVVAEDLWRRESHWEGVEPRPRSKGFPWTLLVKHCWGACCAYTGPHLRKLERRLKTEVWPVLCTAYEYLRTGAPPVAKSLWTGAKYLAGLLHVVASTLLYGLGKALFFALHHCRRYQELKERVQVELNPMWGYMPNLNEIPPPPIQYVPYQYRPQRAEDAGFRQNPRFEAPARPEARRAPARDHSKTDLYYQRPTGGNYNRRNLWEYTPSNPRPWRPFVIDERFPARRFQDTTSHVEVKIPEGTSHVDPVPPELCEDAMDVDHVEKPVEVPAGLCANAIDEGHAEVIATFGNSLEGTSQSRANATDEDEAAVMAALDKELREAFGESTSHVSLVAPELCVNTTHEGNAEVLNTSIEFPKICPCAVDEDEAAAMAALDKELWEALEDQALQFTSECDIFTPLPRRPHDVETPEWLTTRTPPPIAYDVTAPPTPSTLAAPSPDPEVQEFLWELDKIVELSISESGPMTPPTPTPVGRFPPMTLEELKPLKAEERAASIAASESQLEERSSAPSPPQYYPPTATSDSGLADSRWSPGNAETTGFVDYTRAPEIHTPPPSPRWIAESSTELFRLRGRAPSPPPSPRYIPESSTELVSLRERAPSPPTFVESSTELVSLRDRAPSPEPVSCALVTLPSSSNTIGAVRRSVRKGKMTVPKAKTAKMIKKVERAAFSMLEACEKAKGLVGRDYGYPIEDRPARGRICMEEVIETGVAVDVTVFIQAQLDEAPFPSMESIEQELVDIAVLDGIAMRVDDPAEMLPNLLPGTPMELENWR